MNISLDNLINLHQYRTLINNHGSMARRRDGCWQEPISSAGTWPYIPILLVKRLSDVKHGSLNSRSIPIIFFVPLI